MKTVGVDPRLQHSYDEYYTDDISEWRTIGALDKAANIESMCRAKIPSTVLEIGAGEGALLQRLSEIGLGRQHYALDISASGVERILGRRIPSLVECQQFDGYKVPYSDRSFDLAVLSHVVEHLEHPRLLLEEAARVAEWVYVEVPLEHHRGLPKNFVWDGVGHINFYTSQTIRLLVQSCGLEVREQRETHPGLHHYRYRLGSKGFVAFLLKELGLKLMSSFAQRLWTYNSSLLIHAGKQKS